MKKTLLALLTGSAVAMGALSAQAATLKMAYDSDPVSLDIHEQLSGATLQMSHLNFDPLIRWDHQLQFEPRLATKWERIDDLTMRFHLRKGVKFHSGNELTAKDVAFTVLRAKASPDFKAVFDPVTEVKVVDDYTIDLITAKPYPLLLNVATYIFPMEEAFYTGKDAAGNDKAAVAKDAGTFASTNVSGTGPFIVTKREMGVRMEMKRFADYWDKDSKGNVTDITFTPITENATRVAALLAGDVNFIAPVPPNDLERLEKADNVNLVTMPGTRMIMFQMNQQRVEAFKDPRVRLAFAYAINNEGIAQKLMKGFATAAGQMSPQGYQGYNPELTPRFDLKKAQELMKEAGYADGFTISMLAPNNRYVNDAKIAQAVASMLSKINVTVELKTLPKAQYWPEFDARAADMMMIGWHADTEDSANFFEFLVMCPNAETGAGQYNSGNYCNPELDKLIGRANVETDVAKRTVLLQQAEKMAYDDGAFVPLHWQNLAWASAKSVDLAPVVNVMDFPYLGDLVINEK